MLSQISVAAFFFFITLPPLANANPTLSIFEAMDDSLERLTEDFGKLHMRLLPNSTATATQRIAFSDFEECSGNTFIIRREFKNLQRLAVLSSHITTPEGKQAAVKSFAQQRQIMIPIVSGAIFEMYDAAIRSKQPEIAKICKRAADSAVVVLTTLAELTSLEPKS